jgi:hypothetical protein
LEREAEREEVVLAMLRAFRIGEEVSEDEGEESRR